MLLLEKIRRNRYWKISITGTPFFLWEFEAFKAEETWNLVKNFLIEFEICLSTTGYSMA